MKLKTLTEILEIEPATKAIKISHKIQEYKIELNQSISEKKYNEIKKTIKKIGEEITKNKTNPWYTQKIRNEVNTIQQITLQAYNQFIDIKTLKKQNLQLESIESFSPASGRLIKLLKNLDDKGPWGTLSYEQTEQIAEAYELFQNEKQNWQLVIKNGPLMHKLDEQINKLQEHEYKLLIEHGLKENPLQVLQKAYLWGPPFTSKNTSELSQLIEQLEYFQPTVKARYTLEDIKKGKVHYNNKKFKYTPEKITKNFTEMLELEPMKKAVNILNEIENHKSYFETIISREDFFRIKEKASKYKSEIAYSERVKLNIQLLYDLTQNNYDPCPKTTQIDKWDSKLISTKKRNLDFNDKYNTFVEIKTFYGGKEYNLLPKRLQNKVKEQLNIFEKWFKGEEARLTKTPSEKFERTSTDPFKYNHFNSSFKYPDFKNDPFESNFKP